MKVAIFAKTTILDVLLGSEYISDISVFYFCISVSLYFFYIINV